MKVLNRNEYNKFIDKLNSSEISGSSALEKLKEWYNELLCRLSDYEEIVLLLNICIAEDRDNMLDELYGHYIRLDNMLKKHSGAGIEEIYQILYDIGVFSFKFHNYDRAIQLLRKCRDRIKRTESSPLDSSVFKEIYIKTVVLLSYALEYHIMGTGAIEAINNVLNDGFDKNSKMNLKKVDKESPQEVINYFFRVNGSRIYEKASQVMKNEIIHMLSHCFSEYSLYLKKNGGEKEEIFLWERLAKKFIESLGPSMVTCQAIIQAEHGHYWQALETMKDQYIKMTDDGKEKAEIAFYRYYFSNRIGLTEDAGQIEECKNYFLEYAKEARNKDTAVYAWIVNFRETFSKALNLATEEKLAALEQMEQSCADAGELTDGYSYIHPQILEEQERLLLSYQIIRSYLLVNNSSYPDNKGDNGLFEKCVLFNQRNRGFSNINKEEQHDWKADEDVFIDLLGVRLWVRGMSDDVYQCLSDKLGIPVRENRTETTEKHKVVICGNAERAEQLVSSRNEAITYFVHCSDEDWCRDNETPASNIFVFSKIETVFKVAYIQETLENCYLCANRWEAFSVMAPITDNSTFAFQNQGIDRYIRIAEKNQEEQLLFLDKNGYETHDPVNIRKSEVIICTIEANRPENEAWRVYYYGFPWLYLYSSGEKGLIPWKLLDSREPFETELRKLYQRVRRRDKRKRECHCEMADFVDCLCCEWETEGEKENIIRKLMMILSIGFPEEKEKYCTIIFGDGELDGNLLQNAFIILSEESILSFSLRKKLKEVEWNRRYGLKKEIEEVKAETDIKQKEKIKEKYQNLKREIDDYIDKNRNNFPEFSEAYKKMKTLADSLSREIAEESVSMEKYNEYNSEFESMRRRQK